jgi:hypothetical protein
MEKSRKKNWNLVFAFVFSFALPLLVLEESYGFLADTGNHPPPSSGDYVYSPIAGPTYTFSPNNGVFPAVNETYVDPVFGETVKRLTSFWPPSPSNYGYSPCYFHTNISKNSTYFHYFEVYNGGSFIGRVSNCSIVRSNKNFGQDVQFALDDDDKMYYFASGNLYEYKISTDTSTVLASGIANSGQFPNGGSCNFASNDGKYFVAYKSGGINFYERGYGTYSNPPSQSQDFTTIAPDGSGFAVVASSGITWYSVNHTTHTINAGVKIWDTGPHCDLVTASNGVTYMITAEDQTYGNYVIRIPVDGSKTHTNLVSTVSAQSGGGMGRALSPYQDWYCVLYYTIDKNSMTGWTSWSPFKGEIFLVNVLTGDVRRLCHGRSRLDSSWNPYDAQSHGGISPDGRYVIFGSNMGRWQTADPNYVEPYLVTTGFGAPFPSSGPSAPSNLKVIQMK